MTERCAKKVTSDRMYPGWSLLVCLLTAGLALAGCGGGEGGDSSASGSSPLGLDAPDRALAVEAPEIFRVGGFEAEEWAQFSNLAAARFDQEGNLYLLDSRNNEITVVDPTGTYLRTVGGPGEGPGEFQSPQRMAILPGGDVAVFDFGLRGFHIFDAEGEFLRTQPVDLQGLGFPGGDLAWHEPNQMLVSNVGASFRFGPGANEQPTGRPIGLFPVTEESEGRTLYTAWAPPPLEPDQEETLSTDAGTIRMRMAPLRAFTPNLMVGVLPDGRVAVVDSIGWRVKLVAPDGSLSGTLERPIEPTVVDDEIRTAERERRIRALEEGSGGGFTVSGAGGVGSDRMQAIQRGRIESMLFADYIPVIEEMAVDPTGRIWVQRTGDMPGEDGPTDLVTASGEYLGTLPADGVRIPEAFGPDGLMVYLTTDDVDVPVVVVRRLPPEWRNVPRT